MITLNAIQSVFQSPALPAAGWGFVSTFLLCVFLVVTKRWHGELTMDLTDGIQKFHTSPIQLGWLYHGSYFLGVEDFLPLSYLVLSWVVLGSLRWLGFGAVTRMAQVWMWLSLGVGLAVRYGSIVMQSWGYAAAVCGGIVLLALGVWASFKASEVTWAGLRRVVAWVPGLLILTPLVVGAWIDRPVVWLEADQAKKQVPTATVVLLFDELNASASGGLQKVLTDRGLQVRFKAVHPVHGSTTEVVPALFTGSSFEGARPCGLTRVCAENSVLDFSQILVRRSDVDVVGFHHPYCAILGLRSCQRFTMNRSVWEDGRWECAIFNHVGITVNIDKKNCQLISHAGWQVMREQLMDGLLHVPALERGGVVYAHVPLPHPPAAGTGTLADQYARNVRQSERLLEQVLDRLAANKIEPRILIFSDHPLRPGMWCSNLGALFDVPCVIKPELIDEHVPLIVAARSELPSLAQVKSNQQVFDVLREWLRN